MDTWVIAVGIFGLVQLAILGGIAYFLIRKIWWRNAFAAFGYPVEAQFSCALATNGETVFQVTPARSSRAGFILIVAGLVILLFFTLLLPDGTLAFFSVIPLFIGVVAFSIGSRYRVPAAINVSAQTLRAGQQTWPLADIAAISIHRGSSINTDAPEPSVYRDVSGRLMQGNQSTTVMFSRAFNRRAVERSHILAVRRHSGSQETVLCGGLTRKCAEALVNDLSTEIARRASKADKSGVAI